MAYPTIDELCKGKDGAAIKRVLQNCAALRSAHRFARNGYTQKRTHRYTAEIPVEITTSRFSPFKKFFDKGMDKHERQNNLRKFLQMYPQFLVVDKL